MCTTSSHAEPRTRSMATVIALALAVVMCLSFCTAAAAPEGPRMSPVIQCKDDFNVVCAKSASARELWACMMINAEKITNPVCRDYVLGFRACTRDAEKKGSCVNPAADYATSVRRCLRSMSEANISQECLNSRFYFPIAESRNAKW